MASLKIAGTDFNCLEWPNTTIERRIDWIKDSGNYWNGSDRGAAQDVYKSQISVVGIDSYINSLRSVLNANRGTITLSGFGTEIFAPNVDHTGSISATLSDPGKRQHKAFAQVGGSVQRLDLEFTALAPPMLSPTPTLSSLLLQKGWNADSTYEVGKALTYNQTPIYDDRGDDAGWFTGQFLQTKAQTQAILAYLTTVSRAVAFTLPTFGGYLYPFGAQRGAGPFQCVVKDFSFRRIKVSRWMIEIKFEEAP